MKQKRLLPLLASAVCFIVLLSLHVASASISLGSVTGSRSSAAFPGDSVSFEMLLFNIHENSTVVVDIAVEGPDGWSVSASPDSFAMDFSQPGNCITKHGYVCLNTGLGGVMARPVHVIADVPYTAVPGEYLISASSYVGGGDSGVTMMQSRTYHFSVNVRDAEAGSAGNDGSASTNSPASAGSVTASNDGSASSGSQAPGNVEDSAQTEEDAASQGENESAPESDGLTGMMVSEGITAGIFAVVIIIIIASSWKLYKRD